MHSTGHYSISRIAIIDEDVTTRRLLDLTLAQSWGFQSAAFRTVHELLDAQDADPELLLFGIPAETDDVRRQFRTLRSRFPGLPVLLVCNSDNREIAADLMQEHNGAWDYFSRPLDLLRLRARIAQIERMDVPTGVQREARSPAAKGASPAVEGASPAVEGASPAAEIGSAPDGDVRGEQTVKPVGQPNASPVITMDEARAAAIRGALRASAGNVKEAARMLGIGRTTIYTLMEKFGIQPRENIETGEL